MSRNEEIAETSQLMARGSPIRTCIVTRAEHPKADLLRFVVSPEDLLVADLAHKLPGRGMYVVCSRLLVAEAIAKRLFSRAAKAQVRIPDGFLDTLTALMRARVGEALSLARKSGLVIAGFEKVEEALKKGDVAALLHASDAGGDGVKKLGNVVKAMQCASSPREGEWVNVPTYDFLTRDALGHVVGRENAVHVAVLKGEGAKFFLTESRRFALFLE